MTAPIVPDIQFRLNMPNTLALPLLNMSIAIPGVEGVARPQPWSRTCNVVPLISACELYAKLIGRRKVVESPFFPRVKSRIAEVFPYGQMEHIMRSRTVNAP